MKDEREREGGGKVRVAEGVCVLGAGEGCVCARGEVRVGEGVRMSVDLIVSVRVGAYDLHLAVAY